MTRISIDPFEQLPVVLERMSKPGLLLTSGEDGNPMTIGWGTVGIVWRRPVFIVMVRPTRYSYGILRRGGDFSVCVPPADDRRIAAAVAWCGTHSGRDGDKYEGAGLSREPGIITDVPYVAECTIHYECRPVHSNDVLEDELDPGILAGIYPKKDFHHIWWGEILGAWMVQKD